MIRIKLIIILLFINSVVYSQTYFSKTVSKEEGRFISNRIDASEFSISSLDRTGLVKEIHINIELWTLLQEPVEKYLFRWKRGSSVTASDYTTLSKSTLAKYPDLLKRYNSLKPTNVELKYFVSTQLYPKYVSVKNLDVCGKKFINNLQITKDASWGSNEGASGYRKINSRAHFIIIREGKTGNDFVAGSPKDWLSFIKWDDCSGNSNQKSYNTFKYANEMTFFGMEVTKLEVPLREIDAIAKEYNKRENEEDKVEGVETEKAFDDNFLEEESGTEEDDFLSETTSKTNDDDFLSEGNSSDDFLSDNKASDNHKIDSKDNKTGVIDKYGRVLIPYRKWEILEYDDGIAKVSIQVGEYNCNGSTYANKAGYVDKSGEFLDGYTLEFNTVKYAEYVPGGYITITYSSPEAERKAIQDAKRRNREKKEKKRREKERCEREIENWKTKIKNQYR